MICKKNCPKCDSPLNSRDVFRSSYRRESQIINCSSCQTALKPNWGGRAIAVMFLIAVIPAGPLFNYFTDLLPSIGLLPFIMVELFVLLPLAAIAGLCAVTVEYEH